MPVHAICKMLDNVDIQKFFEYHVTLFSDYDCADLAFCSLN